MAGEFEKVCVLVMRFLQFWRNWVVIVAWRCCKAFAFGASADSQEKVEDRPHYITRGSSDGETASLLDATPSGERGWEEITTALNAKSCAPRALQISNNIDPTGEFNVTLGLADEASQPAAAPATKPSAICQVPPPRSLENSKDHAIITAQRTPKPAVRDVKIGKEVWVMNTRYFTVSKPDQIEVLNQDHGCNEVDAFYEDRFREFGKPEVENAADGGRPVEAKRFKDRGHVPPSVSEGIVSTFAIDVDKTMTNLMPSLENWRTAAEDHAEVRS